MDPARGRGGRVGGESAARAEFGVRSITSVANEVRQILWPDGDDAISAIDAIHIGRVLLQPAGLPSPQ